MAGIADFLGEALACLKLRGGLRRPEHQKARIAQRVRHAGGQWCLGADHHEIHRLGLAEGDHRRVVGRIERRQIGPRLSTIIPGIPAGDIEAIQSLPPQNYCTVFAYSIGDSPVYSDAVAVIRAELPPRLRSSCIHEELAQGMGLANDSPTARPSIFNDDEEFALLTNHDALLLQMLYDQRLTPGMTAETATPVVRTIAGELAP